MCNSTSQPIYTSHSHIAINVKFVVILLKVSIVSAIGLKYFCDHCTIKFSIENDTKRALKSLRDSKKLKEVENLNRSYIWLLV